MAVHYYHKTLYSILSSAMISAIGATEPVVSGWNTNSAPIQRIGEWVINAIIRGHRTMDDPVASKFFTSAPAKVRGDALGQIAWSFMHAEIVEDRIRQHFEALWDERVAHVRDHPEDHDELGGFYWFVRSRKFEVEWWLPRLREAVQLHPSLSGERFMIGKELAASADADPQGALEVLKLLLEGRDETSMVAHDLTRNAVPVIIGRAIASGDEALEHDATELINMLGEKGHLSLEDEVRKVLEGTISQADVDG